VPTPCEAFPPSRLSPLPATIQRQHSFFRLSSFPTLSPRQASVIHGLPLPPFSSRADFISLLPLREKNAFLFSPFFRLYRMDIGAARPIPWDPPPPMFINSSRVREAPFSLPSSPRCREVGPFHLVLHRLFVHLSETSFSPVLTKVGFRQVTRRLSPLPLGRKGSCHSSIFWPALFGPYPTQPVRYPSSLSGFG